MTDAPQPPASAIIPYITVKKAENALEFYKNAFQFEPGEVVNAPNNGPLVHVGMLFQGIYVLMFSSENMAPPDSPPMFAPASDNHSTPVNFYLTCKDVDAFTKHAKKHGAVVTQEPTDMFWGDRVACFTDPDGYRWTFATHTGKTFPMPDWSQS